MPLCLSSRFWSGSVGVGSLSFVGEHEPPDTRRDLAFKASHCCFVGFALADLAVVVAPPRAVTHPDLGNSDEMQSRVQFPIPAARQTMDGPLPGGDLYRSDAGIVGERVGAWKPRSPSAAADETNRQHRPDTVDLNQPASIVLEGFGHPRGYRRQSSIDASDLPYQVPCQGLAGRFWWCLGTDPAEKRPRCIGLERRRRTARDQISQQGMELVDRPDPLSCQVRSPLLQQRKHHCYVLGNDYRSVALKRCNTRGRSSVDHVVLTSPAPRQLTHPGGRGGRRVEHHLVLGHKPLSEMTTQTPGVLHRPTSLPELTRPAQQLPVTANGGLDSHRRHRRVRHRVHCRSGMAALMRIHSDNHDYWSFGLWRLGTPRSACRLRDPLGEITPLLSQTAASRQLGGTPRESQPIQVADGSRANPANDLPDATTQQPQRPAPTYKSAVHTGQGIDSGAIPTRDLPTHM